MSDIIERLVRWQGKTVDQFSNLNNLLLTLGIAITGFCFSFLNRSNNHLYYDKDLLIVSIALSITSAVIGILLGLNRLWDFRTTTDVVKAIRADDENLEEKRAYSKALGKRSWILLYLQIGVLIVGILILLLSFLS